MLEYIRNGISGIRIQFHPWIGFDCPDDSDCFGDSMDSGSKFVLMMVIFLGYCSDLDYQSYCADGVAFSCTYSTCHSHVMTCSVCLSSSVRPLITRVAPFVPYNTGELVVEMGNTIEEGRLPGNLISPRTSPPL